jgi:hypothetical protein
MAVTRVARRAGYNHTPDLRHSDYHLRFIPTLRETTSGYPVQVFAGAVAINDLADKLSLLVARSSKLRLPVL